MTGSPRAVTAPSSRPRPDEPGAARLSYGGVVVAALAVTQTVGYGALYYSYAVLLRPMVFDLGASTTAVTGAFTTAILAGAAAAMPVGRWLDRHAGRGLMTTGSMAGTILLFLAAHVNSLWQLYAVWTAIGLASAAVLYEAAFAVTVKWHPEPRARGNAVLAITLVAGFASSIFLPLTGALVATHGWRDTLTILAVIHGAITVPLHLLMRHAPANEETPPQHDGGAPSVEADPRRTAVRAALHDRGFWLLVTCFVAQGGAVAVISVHLVAYLTELGHAPALAATIAGGLGVLSVTGRIVTTGAQRRWPTNHVVAAVFALQAAAMVMLPVAGPSLTGALAAVLMFGLGFGVGTIARPALLADRFGTTGFATISGILAVPLIAAKALAPLGAAGLRETAGSYTPVAIATAVACLVGAISLVLTVDPETQAHARRPLLRQQPGR